MTQEEIDDWIIAYLEGSLGIEENRYIEEQLDHDSQWQEAYEGMKKIRQVPDNRVTFPWKAQLYKPEPRLSFYRDWKVAAAASILILAGLLWGPWEHFYNNRQESFNTLKKDSNIVKDDYSNSGNINDNLVLNSKSPKKTEAGNAQKQTSTNHSVQQHVEARKSRDRHPKKSKKKKGSLPDKSSGYSELSKLPLKADDELLKVEFKAPVVKKRITRPLEIPKMAFQTEKKNADTAQNRTGEKKDRQKKQSLLARIAEKVFKVDIQSKGQNQKAKDRQSIRIETNPLAIRASIQFN